MADVEVATEEVTKLAAVEESKAQLAVAVGDTTRLVVAKDMAKEDVVELPVAVAVIPASVEGGQGKSKAFFREFLGDFYTSRPSAV